MKDGNKRIIQSLTFCQNILNSVHPSNKPTGQHFMVCCLLTFYCLEFIQQASIEQLPNILQSLWGIQNKSFSLLFLLFQNSSKLDSHTSGIIYIFISPFGLLSQSSSYKCVLQSLLSLFYMCCDKSFIKKLNRH